MLRVLYLIWAFDYVLSHTVTVTFSSILYHQKEIGLCIYHHLLQHKHLFSSYLTLY